MEKVTISREEYERMKEALNVIRNIKIYKRLLEFENNIRKGEKYTREDLGF